MIRVVKPTIRERNRIPIECEFCGEESVMVIEVQQVECQIVYKANLEVCCDAIRDRLNDMDVSRGLPN